MMKFLDNAADIMPLLGVEPQGIDMLSNAMEVNRSLRNSAASIIDSNQSFRKAVEYDVISERILEKVNRFFLRFKSLEDVQETLQTHNVTGTSRLEELSARCTKQRLRSAFCIF